MDKRLQLREIIKRNVTYFMALPGCAYRNANALAEGLQGVTPNSVRYLIKPEQRTKGKFVVATLPRLDTLAAIAPRLGCEVWELLHPEIETVRERLRSYEIVEQAMRPAKRTGVSS